MQGAGLRGHREARKEPRCGCSKQPVTLLKCQGGAQRALTGLALYTEHTSRVLPGSYTVEYFREQPGRIPIEAPRPQPRRHMCEVAKWGGRK